MSPSICGFIFRDNCLRIIGAGILVALLTVFYVLARDGCQPSVLTLLDKHGNSIIFECTKSNRISVMADSHLLLEADLTFKAKPNVPDLTDFIKCHSDWDSQDLFVSCQQRESSSYFLEIHSSENLDLNVANQLVLEFRQPWPSILPDAENISINKDLQTIGFLLVNILPVEKSFTLETKDDADSVYKVPHYSHLFNPAFAIHSYVDYGNLAFWVGDDDVPEYGKLNSFRLSRNLGKLEPNIQINFDQDLRPVTLSLHAGTKDKLAFAQKVTLIPNNEAWDIRFSKTKGKILELEYPIDETFIDIEVENLSKDTELVLKSIESSPTKASEPFYEYIHHYDWHGLPLEPVRPLERKSMKIWLNNSLEPGKHEYTVSTVSLQKNFITINVVDKIKNDLILSRTDLGTYKNRLEIVNITSDRIIAQVKNGYYDVKSYLGFELFDKQGTFLARCEFPEDEKGHVGKPGYGLPYAANDSYFVYRRDFTLKVLSARDFALLGTIDMGKLLDDEDHAFRMVTCKFVGNVFYCRIDIDPPKTFVLDVEGMSAKVIDMDYDRIENRSYTNQYTIKDVNREDIFTIGSDFDHQPLAIDCTEICPTTAIKGPNDDAFNLILCDGCLFDDGKKRVFTPLVSGPFDYPVCPGFVCVDAKTNRQVWAKGFENRLIIDVGEGLIASASIWGSQLSIIDLDTGKMLFRKRIAGKDETDLKHISYLKIDNGSIYASITFEKTGYDPSSTEYTKLVRFDLRH